MNNLGEARYLNVDFIVVADFNLAALVEALDKDKVFLLWHDSQESFGSFGIEGAAAGRGEGLLGRTVEDDLLDLLEVLENLPDKARRLLRDSRRKVFDIGFESGVTSQDIALDASLSPETLRRVAQLGCGIGITLYPIIALLDDEALDSPESAGQSAKQP